LVTSPSSSLSKETSCWHFRVKLFDGDTSRNELLVAQAEWSDKFIIRNVQAAEPKATTEASTQKSSHPPMVSGSGNQLLTGEDGGRRHGFLLLLSILLKTSVWLELGGVVGDLGIVKVVLLHFHRSCYRSCPLWFFYGKDF
jgi:hypothetical protein